MAKRAAKPVRIEPSSGNVFADLGLPDAAELDTKVRLAVEVNRLIMGQRLTQLTAAARLEVSQPKISALKNYKLDGFSVERLTWSPWRKALSAYAGRLRLRHDSLHIGSALPHALFV